MGLGQPTSMPRASMGLGQPTCAVPRCISALRPLWPMGPGCQGSFSFLVRGIGAVWAAWESAGLGAVRRGALAGNSDAMNMLGDLQLLKKRKLSAKLLVLREGGAGRGPAPLVVGAGRGPAPLVGGAGLARPY